MKYAAIMYHQIWAGANAPKFSVDRTEFARQIAWIKDNNYKTLDLHNVAKIEQKSVLVTFDDGHASNFAAAQAMTQIGQQGVFYILKNKSLAEQDYLNESQLREMSKQGHELGIHGKDHKWWTKKCDQQFIEEFKETKDWLEQIIGRQVITCSAPGGKIDRRIINLIREYSPSIRYIRNSAETYNESINDTGILNGVAIKYSTSLNQFKKIVTIDRTFYAGHYAMYCVKELVKRVIGR